MLPFYQSAKLATRLVLSLLEQSSAFTIILLAFLLNAKKEFKEMYNGCILNNETSKPWTFGLWIEYWPKGCIDRLSR